MSIEEIIAKTTIELPRSLTLEEAEKLINYIAKELPGNINYNASYYNSVFHGPDNGEISKQKGTANMTAIVNSLGNLAVFDSFQFKPPEEDTSKFSTIRFQIVPDWELSDYRPEVRQLWDEVREIVGQYFKQE